MDFYFDDYECQILNITDITSYKRLEQEKETNELLRTLNTTVHHEMLAPLSANISFCRKLLEKLYQDQWATRIIEIMLVSSQMVLMHANDLLD